MKPIHPSEFNTAKVPVVWSGPFGHHPRILAAVEGYSIADMVEDAVAHHGLPSRFKRDGVVCINGEIVPRTMWRYVRPRADSACSVVITFHLPLMHGGGGGGAGTGGKNPIATVALIAVLATSLAISGGLLTPLLGAAGAFTFGATSITLTQALGAAVLIGGSLAIAAFIPPPRITSPQNNNAVTDLQGKPASLSSNTIQPDATVPRVIGTRRVFPPAGCEPLNELIDRDEYVEVVYVLAGPHALSDARAGNVPLGDIADVSFELQEGRQESPQQSLVQRYGRTLAVNTEMSRHVTLATNGTVLQPNTLLIATLPQWETVITRQGMDEAWIRLFWLEGLSYDTTPGTKTNEPLRFRFRLLGTVNWTNCPEVHFSQSHTGSFQKDIRFIWQIAPVVNYGTGGSVSEGGPHPHNLTNNFGIPTANGPIYAYKHVVGQNGSTVLPATPNWDANSYFSAGAGGDLLNGATANAGTTNVINVSLLQDRVIFWLDPSIFPQTGFYEIQLMKGAFYIDSQFNSTTYQYTTHSNAGPSPAVYDFFNAALLTVSGASAYTIPQDESVFRHRISIRSVANVFNSNPLADFTDIACIALRVRGRSLDQVSVLASGYTYDWDGLGWNTFTTTSNPAPHFRDILTGTLNSDPLPADLVDDASLISWRQRCIDKGYTCDFVCDGKSAFDTLTTVAAAGYARPRQSEKWGVFVDQDLSASAPVQVFNPRNMTGFRFERPFPLLPTGFRVRYDNIQNNYIEDEITVLDPFNPAADTSRLEDMRYDVFVNQSAAQQRAKFDLGQAELRLTFYHGTVDAEALVCRRGDLVGVQHDVINQVAGFSRIMSIVASGGIVSGAILDGSIPVPAGDAWSNTSAAWSRYSNAWNAPRIGIAIRLSDDTLLVKEVTSQFADSNNDALRLSFANPFNDPGTLIPDCLVSSGYLESIFERLLVFEIQPKAEDFTADITLVPEAPELWGSASGARIAREEGLLENLALVLDAGDGSSYYPSGGNNWYDTSGLGNNFGPSPAKALQFNGSSDDLHAISFSGFGLAGTSRSWSIWFKTTGNNSIIIGQTDNVLPPSAATSFVPAVYVGSDGKLYGAFYDGSLRTVSSASVVNDGNWHHAAWLVSGSGVANLYLDNVLVGSFSGSALSEGWWVQTWLAVGKGITWPTLSAGNLYLAGTLQEFRVYNRVLSRSEVTQLYNKSPSVSSGLVGYVPMQSASGTDLSGSGFGFNFSVEGSPTVVAGTVSPLPSFNGVFDTRDFNEFFATGGGAKLVERVKGSWDGFWHQAGAKFTIAALIFLPPVGGPATILANMPSTAAGNYGYIWSISATNQLVIQRSNGTSFDTHDSGGDLLSANHWNFVVVSVNEAGGDTASHFRIGSAGIGSNSLVLAFNAHLAGPTTNLPAVGANIFATADGAIMAPNGFRIMMLNAWNRTLSQYETFRLYKRWQSDRMSGLI